MTNLFTSYGVKAVAFLDFETTGLKPTEDYPTEISIRKVGIGELGIPYEETFESLIKLPEGVEVPEFITTLTGLTTEKLALEGTTLETLIPIVQSLLDSDTAVVAHNANFDLGFLAYYFGVEPRVFFCTRSIEILTAPHLNASLKNVFPRYKPEEASKVQTHRAQDDVNMLTDIFNGQIGSYGNSAFMFFVNKIVIMPDRELVYTPYNAKLLDFTEKYVSKSAYEKLLDKLEYLEQREEKLSALEAYGVDNWSGYGEALSSMDEGEEN